MRTILDIYIIVMCAFGGWHVGKYVGKWIGKHL